jgi:hypothetical protein
LLAFPNLEVEDLATAILLVRPNCKQTDDNITSGESVSLLRHAMCCLRETIGLLPGKQLVVSRFGLIFTKQF